MAAKGAASALCYGSQVTQVESNMRFNLYRLIGGFVCMEAVRAAFFDKGKVMF